MENTGRKFNTRNLQKDLNTSVKAEHPSKTEWADVWTSYSKKQVARRHEKMLAFIVTVCAKSLPLHPTLCDPMDCSLLGFFVHGILQARILEWVAMPFSSGASWPRDRTQVPCISCIGGFFATSTTWEALIVTEETLIQMRANLSLLHLQNVKTNKQTKTTCELSKGLGTTPFWLAEQSLVKCIKTFMLVYKSENLAKVSTYDMLPGFLQQDICLHPHLQLWASVQLIRVYLTWMPAMISSSVTMMSFLI